MHIQDIEPEQDQLAVVVASSPLEKTKAQQLQEMFVPYLDKMSDIEKKIKLLNADTPGKEDIAIAKQIRLALKNNRVAAEKTKDDSKAAILIEGRLIDSLFGVINNTSKGLELQLFNIEKAAEIAEAKRKAELASNRAEQLSMYEIDLTGYDLGAMADNTFAMLLENTKAGHEKRLEDKRKEEEHKVRMEAAIRLSEQRQEVLMPLYNFLPENLPVLSSLSDEEFKAIYEAAQQKSNTHQQEQIRIKEENERLKKETEEKQRIRNLRNDELKLYIIFIRDYEAMLNMNDEDYVKEYNDIKIAAIDHYEDQQRINARNELQAIRLNAVKPYLSFIDTDLNALADLEEITFDALLDNGKRLLEIDEKQKADAKQKLEDAEKEKQRVLAAAKKAERAPDKEKLQGLANDLRNYALPAVKSAEAAAIVKAAQDLLIKTADYIQNKINEL